MSKATIKREYEAAQREWESAIDALDIAQGRELLARLKVRRARSKYLASNPSQAKTVEAVNKATLGRARN